MSAKIKLTVKPKYKECELNGVKLRVYPNGDIWRYVSIRNRYHHQVGWSKTKVNKTHKSGYLHLKLLGKSYKWHRVVYYAFNPNWNISDSSRENTIEHVDRNKTNCRITNLRQSNHSQNQCNKIVHVGSRSGVKNIYPVQLRHNWGWRLTINKNKSKVFDECFSVDKGTIPDPLPPVPQHIIDLRNEMLIKYHGEFANFD